ncbi:MAG TPA: hypothetical protein VLV76_21535 [Candidatus Acidoferrum sp.]|nr:hypothetical protein [Candidatus Acidoferrum sp.]
MTDVSVQIAHQAVENTHRLDTARDKGKTHLDDPPQDFTFDDFLDIINPLQHLPVVSMIYRAITGDKIKPAMRILGDIGYGGPTGFMGACAEVLFEAIFGDDVGGTAISWLTGDGDKAENKTSETAADPSVQLASTDPSVPLPDASQAKAATTAYALFAREVGTHR